MKKNWEKFGEDIRKTVQDAVENQDYDRLSQAISDTINQAVDIVADGVKYAADEMKHAADSVKQEHGYSHAKYRVYSKKEYKKQLKKDKRKKKIEPPVTLLSKAPSKVGAITSIVVGYTLGGIQLRALLMNFLANTAVGAVFGIGIGAVSGTLAAISFALMAAGFSAGTIGVSKVKRMNRFKTYVKAIGDKEYCNISKLAKNAGITEKKVIKDIQYMIKNGWFFEGHLDKQKSCLMITDKMYEEYCQLEEEKALEQQAAREQDERMRQTVREQEAKMQQEAREKEAEQKLFENQQAASEKALSPEVRKVIEQGDEFVRKIRVCNDAIPGEEISKKIYRIELLIDKIFDRVEQEPKCVSDIQKLMDYYLPTTVKLLEAYAEMDAQPIGGENIQNAKKEIETTLDTLNIAFEKLLDSLFLEKAWDVSSDISVLNTMLAQEGLKEDGLKKA